MEILKLEQSAILRNSVEECGKLVDKRLTELNIDNQVATLDTIKSLKELRAALTKELNEFEGQRKAVKKAILKPYEEFEEAYSSNVATKYSSAIEVLKNKISIVETKILQEKYDELKKYSEELCIANGIDFVSLEKMGIKINLSTSLKKMKEEVFEYVERIKSDLAFIKTQEYAVEVLVEYKKSINLSHALLSVQNRMKEEEKLRELRASEEVAKQSEEQKEVTEQKKPIVVTESVPQETFTAAFEVEGTKDQLNALAQFMINNGIKYKNV